MGTPVIDVRDIASTTLVEAVDAQGRPTDDFTEVAEGLLRLQFRNGTSRDVTIVRGRVMVASCP